MVADIRVPLDGAAQTTAIRHPAAADRSLNALLVLAHGAGAGQHHPFMVAFATGLAEAGVDVVTFNFLYAEQRRRVPDKAPALEHCFRRVIDTVRTLDELGPRRLFIGGKSMGGRIATHLAAQDHDTPEGGVPTAHACAVGCKGLVVLGYPLHPPGKPEQRRAAHLPAISVPVLIVQGERDAFGTPSELEPVIATMRAPVTLHVVPGGDHSLAVRGRPREQVYRSVLAAIGDWIGQTST